MTKTKTPKADVYEIVTGKIVDALEAGTVPWTRPWNPLVGMPLSMSTNKRYRGINPWLLNITAELGGYTSPWWGTYDQIAGHGGQVRKDEKSTLVTFWKSGTRDTLDEFTGEPVEKRWAVLRFFKVFNADQADNLPEKYGKAPESSDNVPILAPATILADYFNRDGAPTLNHGGTQAYYSPSRDGVQLPVWEAFATSEGYYSTAFHEVTHSTGHASRLAREGVTDGHFFGDEVYSKEELVAEMGAAMLAGHAGIEHATIERSAAYIRSWITALQGDSKLVVQAAGQAQKAADLVLGTTFDNDKQED